MSEEGQDIDIVIKEGGDRWISFTGLGKLLRFCHRQLRSQSNGQQAIVEGTKEDWILRGAIWEIGIIANQLDIDIYAD